jgi:hypothetical protein
MHPALMLTLALSLPAVMMVLLCGPIYAGAYGGLVLLYGNEISTLALQVNYQLDTYEALWAYYLQHQTQVSFVDFLLPAFGPLVVGVLSGVVFFVMFIRYLKNVFSL